MRKSAEALSPAFGPVVFDLENTPKLERKADPPKEKKKPANTGAAVEGKLAKVKKGDAVLDPVLASVDTGGAAPVAPEEKGQKKEKKESSAAAEGGKKKAVSGGGGGKAAPAEDAGEPVPSMIDLRVGHIVESTSPKRLVCLNELTSPLNKLPSTRTQMVSMWR